MATTEKEAKAQEVSPQSSPSQKEKREGEESFDRETKRLRLVCPRVHEDLCSLLTRIKQGGAGNWTDATEALQELSDILENPEARSDTAEAFFHACGHAILAKAMGTAIDQELFQKEAFEFLIELCNAHKASTKSLKGIEHLVSQGVVDCCLDAMEHFPSNAEIAEKGLWVVSNLLDALKFETIVELGSLARTLQIMKRFSGQGNVQAAGACILQNVADLPGAHRSAFAKINAISSLALVFEERDQYEQDEYDCKDYASRAMNSIVKLDEMAQADEIVMEPRRASFGAEGLEADQRANLIGQRMMEVAAEGMGRPMMLGQEAGRRPSITEIRILGQRMLEIGRVPG